MNKSAVGALTCPVFLQKNFLARDSFWKMNVHKVVKKFVRIMCLYMTKFTFGDLDDNMSTRTDICEIIEDCDEN